MHRDGSYLSANDPRLHFGFGNRTDIDGVRVLWPSGRKEVWKDVPLGGLIRLEEGTGEGLP